MIVKTANSWEPASNDLNNGWAYYTRVNDLLKSFYENIMSFFC